MTQEFASAEPAGHPLVDESVLDGHQPTPEPIDICAIAVHPVNRQQSTG